MGKKLYVGNLSYDVDSSQLEQLFGQFGSVQSAQVISDRRYGSQARIRICRDGARTTRRRRRSPA
jgi:RNA recognition motif-containing protein